jgi:prolyl-tRNA synthetase
VDGREEVTPGFKFNDWEMRGVPLRIEIGPKDVEKSSVALARRDTPGKAGKVFIPQDGLSAQVDALLKTIQQALLERATAFRDSHIHESANYAELAEIVQAGWAFAWWCGDAACETQVKDETKATIRCIPLEQPGGSGECIVCGSHANQKVYFARAY